jgi:UPF0716 protein FxsA
MRRLFIIITLLVIVPIIEIAVLIAVGQVIGAAWTLLLVLATSALGGWLLKREGARAWRTFRTEVEAGRPPGNAATEGFLVLAGGTFMLIPGFVSDIIGGLLILPPTRKLARIGLLRLVDGRLRPATADALFGPRQVKVRWGPAQTNHAGAPGTGGAQSSGSQSSGPTIAEAGRPGDRSTTIVDGGPAIEGEIIDPR